MSDTPGPAFTAAARDTPAATIVEAAGDLDYDTVPTLNAALRQALAAGPRPPVSCSKSINDRFDPGSAAAEISRSRLRSSGGFAGPNMLRSSA